MHSKWIVNVGKQIFSKAAGAIPIGWRVGYISVFAVAFSLPAKVEKNLAVALIDACHGSSQFVIR
jgi:hypothetical protein